MDNKRKWKKFIRYLCKYYEKGYCNKYKCECVDKEDKTQCEVLDG